MISLGMSIIALFIDLSGFAHDIDQNVLFYSNNSKLG